MRKTLTLVVAVSAAAILYVAYVFTPSPVAGYRSPFLASQPSQFVHAGGFRVHFVEEGAGPAVVLIHGGGTWLYSFRHNLTALSRSFRVIALDMPGHGYTVPARGNPLYDFETTDRVLREFLDARGIPEASLVGHSWGGDWALHFAQQHPERVRRLILLASSGPGHEDRLEWELLTYPVIGEAMAKLFRRRAVAWGLEAAFADPALVTPEMVEEIYAPLSTANNRLAQVAFARSLGWDEIAPHLPETQVPTLVAWGSLDRYGSFADGRALAETLPRARFELIANAGHNAHEEKPEILNEMIAAFLSVSD